MPTTTLNNKTIFDKLAAIQAELNAPKTLFNKFGGYSYRSCEAIYEAVKPLLRQQKCTLVLTDEVLMIGDRIYVKATATLKDLEGDGKCIAANAFAREDENKKGMDGSQITGATSSYARKYALNGLFLIDDVKDSDATNTHGKDAAPAPAVSAPAPAPLPPAPVIVQEVRLDDDAYWKAVAGEAKGLKYTDDKTGKAYTYRELFKMKAHPTAEYLDEFDADVKEIKDNANEQ